ncbi:hypothetical protein M501DRAFT_934233 [Patellaria atrata CBS 101060]|uniref:NIMA interactive protein n=1 Tax=Patellaria atrata CBS 101060 TaxID=1346257 RepID=A0A9P4SAU3_9PEZI|nr:hypothetical protein M501DRAFT_934233 [Patellaria atrata CBS 101060]
MDSFNLKTASTYINNLLLARGLLRNGKSIEFARPSKGDGGTEATMAQIINLVHDMILRRDREQDQRESLAQTLRSLRSDATKSTVALERLQTRNEDLARQLSLAQSQERAARAALRTAESTARSLREDMLRQKTTVQQVRTACANDIRKRDVQIQRLKSHLTAQQRGNKSGLVGASITINPGSNGMNGQGMIREGENNGVDDVGYNLKQETTEFLTQLSQSLSDENDNLIGLARSTIITLRELQGMPENVQRAEIVNEAQSTDEEGNMIQALPTSYEALSTDMDSVLENLKTLLTNPNFVSMDEVEVRDEEITRLREGWVKMESRWEDALALMEGWRKRMMDGGDTVNLDELKIGLGLSAGLDRIGTASGRSQRVDDEAEEDDGSVDDLEAASDEGLSLEDEPPLPSPEKEMKKHDSKDDIFNLKLPASNRVLQEGNGNIRSPRKVAFLKIQEGGHRSGLESNASEIDLVATGDEAFLEKGSRSQIPRKVQETASLHRPYASIDPYQTRKRSSSPHSHPDERSSKLTVQQKLDIAQAEAEVAAVAKSRKGEDDAVRPTGSPKKTKISGRPRRRKSTLSPEELDGMLGLS